MSQSTQSLKVTIIDPLVFGQAGRCDGNGDRRAFAFKSWVALAQLLWFQGVF